MSNPSPSSRGIHLAKPGYVDAVVGDVESPDLPEAWLVVMLGLEPGTPVWSRVDALQRAASIATPAEQPVL